MAYIGRECKLFRNATVLAGMRSLSLNFNADTIDISDGEDSGLRVLASASGSESVDLGFEGVMKDDDFIERHFVKASGGLHGLAALVHKCRRLHQQDFLPCNCARAAHGFILGLLWPEVMRVPDSVNRHEADVVPVAAIFFARITKADPNLHDAALLFRWRVIVLSPKR